MQKNAGALPADLKIQNRMLVMNAMRDGKPRSAVDIALETGISRPTVVKAIQYFMDKGLVCSFGKGLSTESGGKKPELYQFVCKKLLLVIMLWPDMLMLNLCAMDLKKIATVKIEARTRATPAAAFALIREKAVQMLREQGYGMEDLYGVSLSTSGTIDYANGTLKYSSSFPDWGNNIPLRDYMQEIFGDQVELVIENAGKMSGRSELLRENIEDKRIVVFFSTWGLSACLIEKGHVLNGGNSLIGEVGHMIIDPDDPELCGCGSYGCAERMLSAGRIRKLVKEGKASHPESLLAAIPEDSISPQTIFSLSAQRDKFAREIDEYLSQTFALVIRNISLVFDPDIIVFQGDYAHADRVFSDELNKNLNRFKYYPQGGAFTIEYNQTPLEELDLTGALHYLQHRFFEDKSIYEN